MPITRPIRVACYHDRLVIVSEDALGPTKTVPLRSRTEESIEEFVSAVWEHMNGWGIAGRGMYWRPILNLHVGTDAQPRFEELQALLEDSGLEVRRR